MIKKPSTENERVLGTVLLIFIVFFGLDAVFSLFLGGSGAIMHYSMTLSFILGLGSGVLFFRWAKPAEEVRKPDKGFLILGRVLSDDEIQLLDIIKASEGVSQDSLRFRTGFSKSKVSALLLNLDKKGIVYREKMGRTYRVFIEDWLKS